MHLRQEAARLDTQLGVQVGERFVHEKDARTPHHGPGESDALALSSRKSFGPPVEKRIDAQAVGDVANLGRDFALRQPADFHSERDVVEDAHMREERVGLEHHRNVAALRRQVGHVAFADEQLAGGDRLEAGDHVERRGLPAARRANQHDERSIGDLDIELRDDDVSAETFLNVDKGHASHLRLFRPPVPPLQPLTEPMKFPLEIPR